jgi:hypothetical protein
MSRLIADNEEIVENVIGYCTQMLDKHLRDLGFDLKIMVLAFGIDEPEQRFGTNIHQSDIARCLRLSADRYEEKYPQHMTAVNISEDKDAQ